MLMMSPTVNDSDDDILMIVSEDIDDAGENALDKQHYMNIYNNLMSFIEFIYLVNVRQIT